MNNWQRKISSGLSYLRRGEFFLLAETLVARLLHERLCRMKKSIFYRLDPQAVNVCPKNDGVTIFRGTESTIPEIVRDLYGNSPEQLVFYQRYFREGIEPWAAQSDEKIIGVVWLYTGSYLSMWEGYDAWLLNVQFEPTGKFFTNVYTDPASRGKGIFSHIAHECFSAYPESPFYSCIEVSNTASIVSHEKIGFRRCGCAYYVRFFQKTFCLFLPKKGKSQWLILERGQAVDVKLVIQKPEWSGAK